MAMTPTIRYVRVGDTHIAYAAAGSGAQDMLVVLPTVGSIELLVEPPGRGLFVGLTKSMRVISFDRRGSGISDRVAEPPTLEEQMDDISAVLDACGSEQVALAAEAESAMLAVMYAATFPDRVSHLIVTHPMARTTAAPGYDWGWASAEERYRKFVLPTLARWGTGENAATLAPVLAARDPSFLRWWGRWERIGASPGEVEQRADINSRLDVREILPRVQTPTLVLDRPGAKAIDSRHARYFAEHIPGARLLELPGRDAVSFGDGYEEYLTAVEEFTLGTATARESQRALATVLFTDIVGSTELAAELGDRRWRETLEGHDRMTRELVGRFGGRAIKSTGDGFLATFDGPARAVRCASALASGVDELGIELRAGLHAGEVELIGADVGGMAVHIGARIGALGQPGEVLASSTVRDLVVGSGIEFREHGERELKGVPGSWRIFSVAGTGE
ncbi:MAG: adenylate/guanylate cyclase domain-containing protein [Solirubrobacterales bacterium]|nr:adenylate/guanylate cyclase domain-containing protein [Solirubrobacterales bacterium]